MGSVHYMAVKGSCLKKKGTSNEHTHHGTFISSDINGKVKRFY